MTNDPWWALISNSKGDGLLYVSLLRKLERDGLLSFGSFLADAKIQACEPWKGPEIPGVGFLSEDSTADLTDWIVSQGEDYWLSVLDTYDDDDAPTMSAATKEALIVAFESHCLAQKKAHPVHLSGQLFTTWCERFDPDEFHEGVAAVE
jgi:hypothetical protein